MNLYEKLLELRKRVTELNKDTEGFGYDYVSGNQILTKVRPIMNELGILPIPTTSDPKEPIPFPYLTKDRVEKKDIIVHGTMNIVFINTENPEDKFTVPWTYYGQMDDASKAYGAALTYAERYFLLKFLGLPTDEDDPDAKDTRHKGALKSETGKAPNVSMSQSEIAKKTFNSPVGTRTISEKQQKRFIAMAGGNMKLVNDLLREYEVKDITQIKMGNEYDSMCANAEERRMLNQVE
jgi:hypothetical protein